MTWRGIEKVRASGSLLRSRCLGSSRNAASGGGRELVGGSSIQLYTKPTLELIDETEVDDFLYSHHQSV